LPKNGASTRLERISMAMMTAPVVVTME